MKYYISESVKTNIIGIDEAIEKKHAIGFIDVKTKEKYLIIEVYKNKAIIIIPKSLGSRCFTPLNGYNACLFIAVANVLSDNNHKITNSFDNYKDAVEWYLEDFE